MTNENDDSAYSENAKDVLSHALGRVVREWQPLLAVAVARMAAERYREWAAASTGERYRSRLLACASREEEIARAVEALYRDAARIEQDILHKNPDLAEMDCDAFAGRPLAEQLLVQARSARQGAVTWRALAQQEHDPARNRAFLACADLEELNALVLEATISPPAT
jgi:hypothetical protein